ncbi:neo-calmodulin-like isoform X2 [Oculina patagonica]
MFDRDNNGYITTKELNSIMKTLGFNPTEEDLQQMIFTVDYDGDGRLNFEEYIQLMEQQKKPEDREEDIIQAFRVFDPDNRGYIESAELRELLENMDWKVSAEDLKDLITAANLHQDRRISMEEFAWLVEPEGLPVIEHEADEGNDD